MIGIGKYNQGNHISGVDIDYANIQQLFGKKFGYTLHFDMDKLQFRQQWTTKNIGKYVKDVKKKLLNDEEKYDGLIFVITGDGDTNIDDKHCLIDSNGNELNLEEIYSSFNGVSKPKLFLVDCSRGIQEHQTISPR